MRLRARCLLLAVALALPVLTACRDDKASDAGSKPTGSGPVVAFTILQMNVTDELRGRIFATMYTLVRFCLLLALTIAPILSQMLDGLADQWVDGEVVGVSVPGVRLTLWLGGLIIVGASVLAARSLRAERVPST